MKQKQTEQAYEDEDYDRAQAQLERIENIVLAGAESDHVLYTSIESIVLSAEAQELKEGMVICLLEKFFLRVKAGLMN